MMGVEAPRRRRTVRPTGPVPKYVPPPAPTREPTPATPEKVPA